MTLGTWELHPAGFLANTFAQWRTLLHEVGHNLGLRHCGTTPSASACFATPSTYESVMSYAHQVIMGTGVNSYSPKTPGVPDPTFDDWFNLREDASRALVHIGNTRLLGLGAGSALGSGQVISSEDLGDIEPGLSDYEQANGPIDVQEPVIDIIDPPSSSSVSQGADLTVTVTATDNAVLGDVIVTFDVDGSGAIDLAEETVVATSSGPDEFEAAFMNIAGSDGDRDITASTSDPSGNVGRDIEPIFVPEPSVLLTLGVGGALVFLLRRRSKA